MYGWGYSGLEGKSGQVLHVRHIYVRDCALVRNLCLRGGLWWGRLSYGGLWWGMVGYGGEAIGLCWCDEDLNVFFLCIVFVNLR